MIDDNYEMDDLPPKTRPSQNNHRYTEVPTAEYKEDKYEKPWERVIYNATKKGKHLSEPVKSIPCTVLLLVFGVYMLLGYLTQLIEDEMPTPVKEVDIARDVTNRFSEEAALRYLHDIIGSEPRVAGTEYHLQKTQDLKRLLDSVAAQATLPVHTDLQYATGDYWLAFDNPHVNRYVNISNVVAVLEGESGFDSNGNIGTSLLLNCHYDSVPFAIGASDNALFCGIMVEVLTRLSRRQTKLKHNIIFLFNGAEESGLQASHGFLQHAWSRNMVAVINLDSTGMNGKANVFQVTDTRVLYSYQRIVTRPSMQGVGEFLFATGIIPSDTDFRIWRDFGGVNGVDIAFIKWGCVYHTRYDQPSQLRAGVAQAAGEMLLALATDVASMDDVARKAEPHTAVYYDYLYLFVIAYNNAAAIAVDFLVALCGLATVALYLWMVGFTKSNFVELSLSVASRVLGGAAGAVLAFLVTAITSAITGHLKYLTQPWVVVAQVWLPFFVASIAVLHLYDSWRLRSGSQVLMNRSLRVYQAQAATRAILSLLLLVTACVPALVDTRYLLAAPLCLMAAAAVISMTLYRYARMQAWQHLLLECVLSIPNVLFILGLSLRINALMMPIMGRTPTDRPDYLVAGLNIGFALLASCVLSGVELLFSRRRLWLVLTALLVGSVVTALVPMFPYQDDGPSTQRQHWFHTEVRTINYANVQTDRYTGIVVTKWDKYTHDYIVPALTAAGRTVNVKTDLTEDCDRRLHCNLPLYRPRFQDTVNRSILLYTEGGRWPLEPRLEMTSRVCAGETCTMRFTMFGPAYNLIEIVPKDHVNVTSWTYSTELRHSFLFQGRPVYQILHLEGTYNEGLRTEEFILNLVVPLSMQSGPILDVVHHANKIHNPEDFTEEYRNILDAMPKYFNIATYISMRTNYEF